MKKGIFLLSIGDELLDGRTQNTNATWFGEQVRLNGISVAEVRCVSDRIEDIVSALKYGEKFPIVISTGGLGPTNDDRTLQAASKAFRKKLASTNESLKHVTDRYKARNLPLTESRLRLTLIPQGSKIIANPTGTAPGVHFKKAKTDFYFLPGPPNECKPMFEKKILPLAKRKVSERKLLHREFWRTFGRGESEVYQRIAPLIDQLEKKYPKTFTFGVHISFPCIDLSFEVWSDGKAKRPTKVEISEACSAISDAIGDLCFTRSRETLPEMMFRYLKEKNLTIAAAESCTGGMLAKLITDFSGSSKVFLGGAITYANSAKEILVQVKRDTLQKHGAVSEEVVKEMAEGIRKKLGADYGIAISGVSGPDGGTAEKPVGTICLAISGPRGTKTLRQSILAGKGNRDQNRVIAVHMALDLLRGEILSIQN